MDQLSRRSFYAASIALMAVGCGSGSGGSTGPAPTGSVHATVVTTGHQLDPDGYLLHVDTLTRALPDSGSALIAGLTPGNVQLQITGIAANCAPVGPTTRQLAIVADSTVDAALSVTCDSTYGGLKVVFSISGGTPDSNGYLVKVDAGVAARVADADSIVDRPLLAGAHTLTISDVAANCTVSGGTSRSVAVPAGRDTTVAIAVSCPTPTTVTVHVTTSGSHLDPDGYTVTIDSGVPVPVSDSGTLGPVTLSPGTHNISLGGVVMNCTVGGAASQSVTAIANSDTPTAFSVSCAPPAILVRINGYTLGFINPDGTNMDSLSLTQWHGFYPAWSPARNAIVFRNGTSASIITPSGALVSTLPFDVSSGSEPRWSPDGSELLVERTSGVADSDRIVTYHDLYRVTVAGAVLAQVTNDSVIHVSATGQTTGSTDVDGDWSPNGSQIVYVRIYQDSTGEYASLIVADSNGGSQRVLGVFQATIGAPRWSPDGSIIVFPYDPYDANGQHGLGSVHADGSNFAMIGSEPALENGVAWSPDGTRLVIGFVDPISGGNDIRVMNADGSNPHDFLNLFATPDWR